MPFSLYTKFMAYSLYTKFILYRLGDSCLDEQEKKKKINLVSPIVES